MRLKKTLIFILISIFVLQFCSCSSENKQIKKEKQNLANYIMANLDNDDIKVAKKGYYEASGIYITLYGSDKTEDVLELITICDEWINNNQDSYAVRERLNITVELYLNETKPRGCWTNDYVARISNYSSHPQLAPSSKFDCLDINSFDSLQSSDFRDLPNDYRYISLPSTVEIDDFEVFVDMTALEELEICDYPFEGDPQRVRDKYNEIMEIADDYTDLQFEIYYRSSDLD